MSQYHLCLSVFKSHIFKMNEIVQATKGWLQFSCWLSTLLMKIFPDGEGQFTHKHEVRVRCASWFSHNSQNSEFWSFKDLQLHIWMLNKKVFLRKCMSICNQFMYFTYVINSTAGPSCYRCFSVMKSISQASLTHMHHLFFMWNINDPVCTINPFIFKCHVCEKVQNVDEI